ncbi:MAG: TetR/AcrR family transcriptional regulator [Atribacterota bacterium]|nr:TetR/AcrR family transcriptional regulator [Atribacterota bacterium]
MPKILDKIEEKINQSAFKLFAKKGYSHVTMKMVANDVGISVGTLYNYFSNKEDLFLAAFKQSFNQMHVTLENIIEKEGSPHEFVSALYNEVVNIKGFSREFLRNKINHKLMAELKNHFLILMRSLIDRAEQKNNLHITVKEKERLVRLLIVATHDFAREFPADKEENINFISKLIEKIG